MPPLRAPRRRSGGARSTVAALAALATLAIVLPAAASASSVSFSGDVLTFNAAPGEENRLSISHVADDCGSRPAPCIHLGELGIAAPEVTSFPATRCSRDSGMATTYVECDVPASVVVNLGDMGDSVDDWDRPSQINGGPGDDFPKGHGGDDTINGEGGDDQPSGGEGNDTINGASGNDSLAGDQGNDTLAGGEGDDSFEGWWGGIPFGDPAGSDAYVGGPGDDHVDYLLSGDGVSVSLDGARNDGAPGEADNVGADVERVRGGGANDVLTGNAADNRLDGDDGDDTLRGGAGDDELLPAKGDDRLFGDAGEDSLRGGFDDDELDGGPGEDFFDGDGTDFRIGLGNGSDRILARDGINEDIRCGGGEDSAIVDAGDLTDDCEQVDRAAVVLAPRGDGSTGGSSGTVTPAPSATPTGRKASPYAKCKRLKGKKKKACVKKVKALKRCSRLKGKKKKACVRKVTRRLSGTRGR